VRGVRGADFIESHRLGPSVRPRRETTGAKLGVALELFEAGVAMMRAQLKLKKPRASARSIERMLVAWLADKPAHDYGSLKLCRREPRAH
jgi:hypothetical protein